MQGPETRLRKKIVEALQKRYPKGYFRKVHGNQFQNIGVPDLLCCVNGRFLGLEIKLPGKKPTPAQILELQKIAKAGGVSAVVTSVAEALDKAKEISEN